MNNLHNNNRDVTKLDLIITVSSMGEASGGARAALDRLLGGLVDLRVELVDLVLARHRELDQQLLVVPADEDVG